MRSITWICFAGLALLTMVGRAASAPDTTAVGADVVELPPLIVEWKNAPLPWRYLALPGFELLTVCDDETAMDFVRRNHRIKELLHAVVPERFLFKSSVPEAHILFNEEAGRARSREVIDEMVRHQGATLGRDGTVQFRQTVERSVLNLALGGRTAEDPAPKIFFLPNLRLDDRDSLAVFSILADNDSALSFSYSEDRVRFLLERRTPALPEWFIEGTVGVFRRSTLDRDAVAVKPAVWFPEEETREISRDYERPRILLPMMELFSRTRPERGAPSDPKDGIWQAQCALFVRWSLAKEDGTRRDALGRFVDRLEEEPLSEAMFVDCFGIGFADMRDRLSDYLPEAARKGFDLDVPKGERLPRLKLRPATDLEVARIRGDWERRQIAYVRARYPDLAGKYLEQTRTTLHKAYAAGERHPQLLAQLGLTELEAGDRTNAERFLAMGVTDLSARPGVLFELARLRYEALPADNSKLTAAQTTEILSLLERAREQAPALIEVYDLTALVWSRRTEIPDRETLTVLSEGVRLFPRATPYAMHVIYFSLAAGEEDLARKLTEVALRHAREPRLIEMLRTVRAELASARES
jgi:hypothetical protein